MVKDKYPHMHRNILVCINIYLCLYTNIHIYAKLHYTACHCANGATCKRWQDAILEIMINSWTVTGAAMAECLYMGLCSTPWSYVTQVVDLWGNTCLQVTCHLDLICWTTVKLQGLLWHYKHCGQVVHEATFAMTGNNGVRENNCKQPFVKYW